MFIICSWKLLNFRLMVKDIELEQNFLQTWCIFLKHPCTFILYE